MQREGYMSEAGHDLSHQVQCRQMECILEYAFLIFEYLREKSERQMKPEEPFYKFELFPKDHQELLKYHKGRLTRSKVHIGWKKLAPE